MLEITIPEKEYFNSEASKIIRLPEVKIRLEHSLLSISKWESKWEKPFLSREKMTGEQLLSYVSFMALDEIDDEILGRMGYEELTKMTEYINGAHSATTFSSREESTSNKIITSEVIYYWMISYQIPFSCETWPLSRLMNLIRIAQIKAEEADPKNKRKRTSRTINDRAALNRQRREQAGNAG